MEESEGVVFYVEYEVGVGDEGVEEIKNGGRGGFSLLGGKGE